MKFYNIKSVFFICTLLALQSFTFVQCTSREPAENESLPVLLEDGGEREALIEVNGDPVFKDELIKKFKRLKNRFLPLVPEAEKLDLEALLTSAAKNLVQDKIILQEATRQKIFVIESEVEAAVNKSTAGYSQEALRDLLREKGVSGREWREDIAHRLLLEKISRRIIEKSLTVTDQEIQEYYRKNMDQFVFPLEARALHILVLSREEANSLQDDLLGGAEFSELARKHSVAPEAKKGGDLGFFSVGQMPEEFEEVIFSLAIGEISDVLATPYGYHLFTLVEKRTPVKKKSNLAIKMIRRRLLDKKHDNAYKSWVNMLLDRADITYTENWKSYILKEKANEQSF